MKRKNNNTNIQIDEIFINKSTMKNVFLQKK